MDDVVEEVKLIGEVSITAQLFTSTTGEITFTSSFIIDEERYRNLPFLRLTIQKWDPEEPVDIDDDYSSLIPYLKQLSGFRRYFHTSLVKRAMQMPVISECDLFEEGIQIYDQRLHTYSDVQGLISQAKNAVRTLDVRHPRAERNARGVLEAMDRIPLTDIKFIC